MIKYPLNLKPKILAQSLLLFLWAIQSGSVQANTVEVTVNDDFFNDSTVHVKVGDTVQWVWQDTINPHTTTSGHCSGATCTPDNIWDSGPQTSTPGFTFTKTPPFTTPGTYPYFCKVHGALFGMTGRVIVDAPTASCSDTDPVNLDPIPKKIDKDAAATVALQDIANGQGLGLVSPNWGTAAPGDQQHLFVTDTIGKLWAINLNNNPIDKDLVLDVSTKLVTNLGQEIPSVPGYDERGLLGVAFHPKYQQNGLIYTFTSEPFVANTADFRLHNLVAGKTPDNLSVVSEWKVDDPTAAHPKVSGDRRVLMRIEHPELNHNGGALNFGRDGMLYISLGDGGNANDQDDIGGHTPNKGNGQDRSTVLGKILRIDPLKRTSTNGQYGIPSSNPFVAKSAPPAGGPGPGPGPYGKKASHGGEPGCTDANKACDEIWAYGFRNPYRFSFDISGKLLAADVGQNKIEEVDLVKKGKDYGWSFKEGSFFFLPNGNDGSGAGFVSNSKTCRPDAKRGLVDPVAEYDHDEGIAIVGGFVYNGQAIPSLKGQYVFGDYAKVFASANPDEGGRLFHFIGNSSRKSLRTITEFRLKDDAPVGMSIFGFAQDAKGELYVLGNTSGVPAPRDPQGKFLETGIIKKLVPAP